jgi:hypothetical protein
MNMNPGYLFVSLLLSAVGFLYMALGKRRQQGLMRGCGLGLLICPLLISHLAGLLVAGALLCALPPLVERYY